MKSQYLLLVKHVNLQKKKKKYNEKLKEKKGKDDKEEDDDDEEDSVVSLEKKSGKLNTSNEILEIDQNNYFFKQTKRDPYTGCKIR